MNFDIRQRGDEHPCYNRLPIYMKYIKTSWLNILGSSLHYLLLTLFILALFRKIIDPNIIMIPTICNRDTFSARIRCAQNTAAGNSRVSRIALIAGPIFGIPLVKHIGGIMVPNKAKKLPHCKSPTSK